MTLEQQNAELLRQNAELVAHIERLRSVLTPKAIELIQQGICANYSGEYYCEAIKEFYDPIFTVLTDTPADSYAVLRKKWAKELSGNLTVAIEKAKAMPFGSMLVEK